MNFFTMANKRKTIFFPGPMSNTLSVNLLFSQNSSEISDDYRQNLGRQARKKMKTKETRTFQYRPACHSACVQIPKQSNFHKPQQKLVISCDYVLNVPSFLFVFWLESLGFEGHHHALRIVPWKHEDTWCAWMCTENEKYAQIWCNVSRHVYGTTIYSN